MKKKLESCGIICEMLRLAVLIQYWRVTDRRTDDRIYRASITSRGKNELTVPVIPEDRLKIADSIVPVVNCSRHAVHEIRISLHVCWIIIVDDERTEWIDGGR